MNESRSGLRAILSIPAIYDLDKDADCIASASKKYGERGTLM